MKRIEPGPRHRFVAWVTLAGFYLTYMWTWLIAWMNPSKTVLISINNYSEAVPELILWSLLAPSTIYVLCAMIHNLVLDVIETRSETEVI